MTSASAPLVLNKRALCGLNVRIWNDQPTRALSGLIALYDEEHDGFVVIDSRTSSRYAVQFNQFTVLEEEQQLVLNVTKATPISVPDEHISTDLVHADIIEKKSSSLEDSCDAQKASAQVICRLDDLQLGTEGSQQLTGLVGQCFSQTGDNFTQRSLHPSAIQPISAGDEGSVEVDSIQYWGSPIRCENAMVAAVAPCVDTAAAAVESLAMSKVATSQAVRAEQLRSARREAEPIEPWSTLVTDHLAAVATHEDRSVASVDGSLCHCSSGLGSQGEDAGQTAAAAMVAANAPYSSFQEISRLISAHEPVSGTPIPITKQSNSGKQNILGIAARLVEETASWGTPRDGSSWGTPRDQHVMDVSNIDAAASSASNGTSNVSVEPSVADAQQQHVTGVDAGQSWLPKPELHNEGLANRNGPAMSQTMADAPAWRAIDEEDSPETDFVISVGVYEEHRSGAGFNSRRSRELSRIPSSEATDAGMMVDIPQPLSSRRVSRTSVRNMFLGSDPGAAGAAGGLAATGELRRAASGMSGLGSRRISRTTSSRLTADQDITVLTPDSGMPQMQQPQQSAYQGFSITSAGVPVHVPGPTSRRASRTLSGRLPLDQDGAVFLAQLPDDSAPDVLTRPVTATSAALETIVSRRQSSNEGRPGTPDSDGFGYSEFEGIEPLVPPEVAQWDAIVEQAALHNADATIPPHQSHRHQRRSVRNMGIATAAAAAHRPSMRISDQDDHQASPLGLGAASNRNHVCELQSVGQCGEESEHPDHQQLVSSEAATSPLSLEHSSGPKPNQEASQHEAAAGSAKSIAREQAESGSSVIQPAHGFNRLTSLGERFEASAAAPALVHGSTADTVHSRHNTPEVASFQVAGDATSIAGLGHRVLESGESKSSAVFDGSLSGDSFSCPPFMPLAGSSAAFKYNPFADPDLFYCTIGQQGGIAAAYQTGTTITSAGHIKEAASSGSSTALLPEDEPEFSEWGSGRFAAHITSGIDTPTGSGIFKVNPFAEGSECGSASSSHIDGFHSLLTTGKAGVGASRMAREAAAAAALIPFDGLAADVAWKSSGISITEITPASDDEDGPAEGGEACNAASLHQTRTSKVVSSSGHCGLQCGADPIQPVEAHQKPTAFVSSSNSSSKQGTLASSDGSSSALVRNPAVSLQADDELYIISAHSSADKNASAAADGGTDSDTRTPAQLEADSQRQVPVTFNAQDSQVACGTTSALGGDAGLIRRPASRTLSQNLSRDAVSSTDGITMLPEPKYNYGDVDEQYQPLVHQLDGMTGHASRNVPKTIAGFRIQTGRVFLYTLLTHSAHWYDNTALVVLGGQLLAAMANPQLSQQQQTCLLFTIFAAGHAPWLVGCFMWPRIAGRAGTKAVLAGTVGLSAFATALIGCMPAYSEGSGAGIAIIFALRILSGLSMGNHIPVALSHVTEYAPQLPNLHASLVMGSMACGALGAGAIALFLALVLSKTQLEVFGWRLLLVASLLVNGTSGWLRGFVLQDPEQHSNIAEVQDRQNSHVWRVIRSHAPQVAAAVLLQLYFLSGLYLLTAWMPTYFMRYTGLPVLSALTAYVMNMLCLVGCIPLGGFLADQHGRTSVLLATCAAAAAFAYPAWLLFSLSAASVSWFAHFVLVIFVGLHCGALGGALVELFPPGVRCSALTLSVTLPTVLFGSMVPLMALSLIQHTGSLSSPAILLIITAVTSSTVVIYQELWH